MSKKIKMESVFVLTLSVIVLSLYGQVSGKLEVVTTPEITAFTGDDILLPCNFTGGAEEHAVRWSKPNDMGQPVIVVQNFNGQILEHDEQKYNMTADFSMVIYNVEVSDEANYSCEVSTIHFENEHNETFMNVIALAKYPTIQNCTPVAPGECEYTMPHGDFKPFRISCELVNIYPSADITWSSGNTDRSEGPPTITGPDDNGLYDVSIEIEVTQSDVNKYLKCQASGDAVDEHTSTVRMHFKQEKPPETSAGGLSSGAVAAIVIVMLIIVIASAGFGFFLWRREQDKTRGNNIAMIEELSPEEVEFKKLLEKIQGYTPGAFSPLESRDDQEFPSKTRLAVFGVTGAGKSSLVRSLTYAVTGEWRGMEISKSLSAGGITVDSKPYKITDYISVVDNRGLRDLDTKLIPDMMKLIRGESGKLHGDAIACPILVFDPRQPIRALETFLPEFVGQIRKEYASHPPVVFTHKDGVTDKIRIVSAQATGMGALDQRVFFIENFTDEPAEEDRMDRRVEFLKDLEKFLMYADENMAHRSDKNARVDDDDTDNAQPLIESNEGSANDITETQGPSTGNRFFRDLFKKKSK